MHTNKKENQTNKLYHQYVVSLENKQKECVKADRNLDQNSDNHK